MLVVNDERYFDRAEIIWEKGTNRAAFFRGEVDKYTWVDVGSSFLPSEITAAFLFAQIGSLQNIQDKRNYCGMYISVNYRPWQNKIKYKFLCSLCMLKTMHTFFILFVKAYRREQH